MNHEPKFDSAAAVSAIASLAQDASSAKDKVSLVSIPNHPLNALLIVNPDGRHEEYVPPARPRSSLLHCIDQVGLYAIHVRDRWGAKPTIYYSDGSVRVKLFEGDSEQFADIATYDLVRTTAWALLETWAEEPKQAWLGHVAFMRMLRQTLGDCFADGELKLLSDQIGQLDFIQGDRAQSVAVRNRESMGREIAHEVKAMTGEIPEEVLLDVRIFRDPVLTRKHEIRCLLETDPKNGLLALIPFPGQIEDALDQEMAAIGDMLRSNVRPLKHLADLTADAEAPAADPDVAWEIPVFYGTP